MTQHRFFRFVMIAVLMAVLLLLYAVHPLAGWTALVALAIFAVGWKKRARTTANPGV